MIIAVQARNPYQMPNMVVEIAKRAKKNIPIKIGRTINLYYQKRKILSIGD